MAGYQRILVRATNWVGDAVMSLPALAALRSRFPSAHIAVLARPWVADLYRHEPFADEIIPYTPKRGWGRIGSWREAAARVKAGRFDCALLLQNAFDAAAVVWMAGVPERIGYDRDGRGLLLTRAVELPLRGEVPVHESFYYIELLRRVGWVDALPSETRVVLAGAAKARALGEERWASEETPDVIGISPGAAYGTAKRWWPERFVQAGVLVARATGYRVALFGSPDERALCESIRGDIEKAGVAVRNFAGQTSLGEFIERAAACRVFLTNDSGAMHIASALGVPTVAVFGATNDETTGPAGPRVRVVREYVACSPCQLRECPIDHRCMAAVGAERVARVALDLLQEKGSGHTQ